MNATLRVVTIVVLAAMCGSCNRRNSPFEAGVTSPSATSASQSDVSTLRFAPGATAGQATVQGTITLTSAAPGEGLQVSLSSSDSTLVSVPATVAVPAGSESVQFQATAQVVSTDRYVTVTATSPSGRRAAATVWLWAVVPNFFGFFSDPLDGSGRADIHRLTPPSATVSASCEGSSVFIGFSEQAPSWQGWNLTFKAPFGVPLSVGTYEGAIGGAPYGNSQPGLDLHGSGLYCGRSTGRFVVHEADITPTGQVRRFWATFQQDCGTASPAVYGDVRVTDAPLPFPRTCLR